MSVTIEQALDEAREKLSHLAGHDFRSEAAMLLGFALEKPNSYLYTWPDRILDPALLHRYRRLVGRRARGEPLAYILGKRAFWNLELKVTPDTLIPRPDTELLIERALTRLAQDRALWLADLGTGSGAIGLTLASERPRCRVILTDVSRSALDIARHNTQQHGLRNVHLVQGDWCRPFAPSMQFHMLISNPPYIAADDPHLHRGDLPWEPRMALESGRDGLAALRAITAQAPRHLVPGAWLLLEHGCDQGQAVRALLKSNGFDRVSTHRDLAGLDRVTEGCLGPADKKS